MSENIFNIIKYPISLPITGEKLDTLPGSLYTEWVEYVVKNEYECKRPCVAYYDVYAFEFFFNNIPSVYHEYYIKELHKRILCYSEE